MSKSSAKLPKNISDNHLHQINVLKALSGVAAEIQPTEPKQLQIHEISAKSGLKDEKETQRYLFILEGQKLVTPLPAGDFTSRTWQITKQGIKAVKMIQKSQVQAS